MLQYSKDGTSVSAMLDTRRTKSDGKCPVKIRVTHRRTRWYYPTGKDLTPEEWSALSTTKARALVSIRKDIESSYQIVRSAVEELTTAGGVYVRRPQQPVEGCNVRYGKHGISGENLSFQSAGTGRNGDRVRYNLERYRTVRRGAHSIRCRYGVMVGAIRRLFTE